MEEKKEIIDMLIQRETFYRCNEDGSFSKVDLVNEFYEDICKELDRAREEGKSDVDTFMEFLRGHSLVKDVHFYRGDGEREIIIKLTTK